jgi:hypothetical protein
MTGRPLEWARTHVLRPVGPLALGVGYAVALAATYVAVQQFAGRDAGSWIAWCSTDLDNLATRPVAVLVTSAFVGDDTPWPWMCLAVIGAWAAGRCLGVRAVALVAATTHVLATVVSEGILARRIALGHEPVSLRQLLDVGPSYVVLAMLVLALVTGHGLERVVAAAATVVVAPSLFDGLDRWDVAAVGHCSTIVIAAVLALTVAPRLTVVPNAAHGPRLAPPPAPLGTGPLTPTGGG